MIGVAADFLVNLVDGAGNDAAVFIVRRRSVHCKCFACTGLPVAHYGSIVAVGHLLHCLQRAEVKDVLLRGIMHDLVEFELPILSYVIYETSTFIFRNVNRHVL